MSQTNILLSLYKHETFILSLEILQDMPSGKVSLTEDAAGGKLKELAHKRKRVYLVTDSLPRYSLPREWGLGKVVTYSSVSGSNILLMSNMHLQSIT
jgi:hypothetical protein